MRITSSEIASEVEIICRRHNCVLAAISMGSCARGEETYFINEMGQEEMMSDFEMLIITETSSNTEVVDKDLNELRKELKSISHSCNFDLEWSYKTIDELKRLDKRFIFLRLENLPI